MMLFGSSYPGMVNPTFALRRHVAIPYLRNKPKSEILGSDLQTSNELVAADADSL
jgi:hypothetical protein